MITPHAARWALWSGATLDAEIVAATRDVPNVNWVGLANPGGSQVEAAKFAATHEIPHIFPSIEYLFRSALVDAVFIDTPGQFQAGDACHALDAGRHVLASSLGGSPLDTIELAAEIAGERNLVFAASHPHRYHPQTAHVASLIGDNDFGALRYMRVDLGRPLHAAGEDPRLSTQGGGALAALMPSALCYVLDFAGEPVGPVRCFAQGLGAMVDIRCTAHFTTEQDITAVVTVALDVPHRYQVIMGGSKGKEIILDDPLQCRTGHIIVNHPRRSHAPPWPGQGYTIVPIDPANKLGLAGDKDDAPRAEFAHISAAILHNKRPRWAGDDAARAALLLHDLRNAVRSECDYQRA